MLSFGIFDHVDDNGSPRGEQFEDRIRLVELLEAEASEATPIERIGIDGPESE